VDNKLSQTAPCGMLAFGGTVGRKESERACLPGTRRDLLL
jgi:hypothetical protein